MAAKRAAKKKTARPAPAPRDRAIDAAMTVAAEIGWREATLTDIADQAGLSLAALYEVFPSKGHILGGFVRRIDDAVLAGDPGDLEGESPRDRLFDVLMRRLDALDPYKPALANIVRDGAGDPVAVLCAGCRTARSMAWMLEAAGISSAGLKGRIRVKGLIAIWVLTLRAWLSDDSADKAHTMAVLDRNLSRADAVIARCRGRGREPQPTAA
jgi:AcrR family transcriptional regulator